MYFCPHPTATIYVCVRCGPFVPWTVRSIHGRSRYERRMV